MSTTSKGLSSVQMEKRYGIRQSTAWFFMRKVRNAMKSSKNYPLSELVYVDEFTVSGKKKENKEEGIIQRRKKL